MYLQQKLMNVILSLDSCLVTLIDLYTDIFNCFYCNLHIVISHVLSDWKLNLWMIEALNECLFVPTNSKMLGYDTFYIVYLSLRTSHTWLFSPIGSYSWCLLMEGWPGWVELGGSYIEIYSYTRSWTRTWSPIPVLSEPSIEQPCWRD